MVRRPWKKRRMEEEEGGVTCIGRTDGRTSPTATRRHPRVPSGLNSLWDSIYMG
jgi:hypothetical protein